MDGNGSRNVEEGGRRSRKREGKGEAKIERKRRRGGKGNGKVEGGRGKKGRWKGGKRREGTL